MTEAEKRRNVIGATAVIYTFMNLCLKRLASSIYLYKHTYSVVAQAVQYKNHGALHKNRKNLSLQLPIGNLII